MRFNVTDFTLISLSRTLAQMSSMDCKPESDCEAAKKAADG